MKYFTIKELTESHTAKTKGIDNTPVPTVKSALTALINNVLDPLREAYGAAIYVNSGYRCPKLNAAVGGAKNSQHIKGEAADITTGTKSGNKQLFELAQRLKLPFDQLIDEKGYSWVHISHKASNNRRQILRL